MEMHLSEPFLQWPTKPKRSFGSSPSTLLLPPSSVDFHFPCFVLAFSTHRNKDHLLALRPLIKNLRLLQQQIFSSISKMVDPCDVPVGVITGDDLVKLLKHAKDNGYAIPAFNCTRCVTLQ